MNPSIVRIAILMLPALAAFVLELTHEYAPRRRSAVLFAGLWSFLAALCFNTFAVQENWWGFTPSGAALYGVPVDLMMAPGFVAGAATMLAQGKRGYFAGAALSAAAILLLYVPALGIVILHSHAAFGLALLVVAAVPPAWLLGYWTVNERQVYGRSFLQALIWATLLLWLLPSAALVNTGGDWAILSSQSPLLFIPMLIPVAMIANALWVFAKYGDGTGFPYDPPKKLVTRGIYQYISNPTQLAICIAMGWWGLLLHSYVVMSCAPVAVLLFVVFKDVCNGSSNLCGNDPEWRSYHQRVPRWFPQIRRKG